MMGTLPSMAFNRSTADSHCIDDYVLGTSRLVFYSQDYIYGSDLLHFSVGVYMC